MRYTLHLSAWRQSGTLTTPNAGEDAETQEVSLAAGGHAERHAALEDGVAVSHETEHPAWGSAPVLRAVRPKESQTHVCVKTSMRMFPNRCPSGD